MWLTVSAVSFFDRKAISLNELMDFLAGIGWLLMLPILAIVALVYVRARYKIADANEATQTTTMINVVVEWTAQLRADTSRDEDGRLNESLRNAILGFTNYEGRIADSLQQTLEGEVRAVIATLTPEELVRDKAGFAEKVNTGVRDSMADLGFKLVSLNIGKISDPNGYYDHLSANALAKRNAKLAAGK